jgi:choline dehydrogenase-like flavoprotein
VHVPRAGGDADGRGSGLEGLWVMDASVIARLSSANTHLAVIALAERLAARFAGAGGPPATTAPSGAGAT